MRLLHLHVCLQQRARQVRFPARLTPRCAPGAPSPPTSPSAGSKSASAAPPGTPPWSAAPPATARASVSVGHPLHPLSPPVYISKHNVLSRLVCLRTRMTRSRVPVSVDCPAGQQYLENETRCEKCPIGFYNTDLNPESSTCVLCSLDLITPSTGSTSERDCSIRE